jgi:hypothetical protein
MAQLDLGPVIRKAMQAQMDHFKEEIRTLCANAWQEGYRAGDYDASLKSNTIHTNPYLKENESGGTIVDGGSDSSSSGEGLG